MTFKQRLQDDLTSAMREKDETRKRTLRMVLAAVKYSEVERGVELTDADVHAILQKEVKQRRETLEQLGQIERPEMAAAEQAELAILIEYLPKQLGRGEIEDLARKVITELGAQGPAQMGQVMGTLMPQVKGQADGKLVSQVVRGLLSD
jgi:uncharacterized protein YqeY